MGVLRRVCWWCLPRSVPLPPSRAEGQGGAHLQLLRIVSCCLKIRAFLKKTNFVTSPLINSKSEEEMSFVSIGRKSVQSERHNSQK